MDKQNLNAVLGIVAREARRKSGLSLQSVGDEIGCNRRNVSHLELGKQGWSVQRFVAYARAVNASPSHLLRVALSRRGRKTQPDSHEEHHQDPAEVRAP